MIIRHKGIFHERSEDAPFIGALVCAIDCHFNCEGCFNQHIKDEPILINDSQEIINKVLLNPFNQGIILSGLEWTLQPEEMRELIHLALDNELEVILYTGLDEDSFKKEFNDICMLNLYIKFGKFEIESQCNDNKQYSVNLANSNQKIIKYGDK